MMAGDYPALHWWPTFITAWVLALIVVRRALTISLDKNRKPGHLGVELFLTVAVVMTGSLVILGITTWLGLVGQTVIVLVAALVSVPMLRGPDWAKGTTLALHVGLALSVLGSHAYFSSLQSREGKMRYALLYGSGVDALRPMLMKMPLEELYQLTEKTLPEGRGARLLSDVVEERGVETAEMKDAEIEALLRKPMSDQPRAHLSEALNERKAREAD